MGKESKGHSMTLGSGVADSTISKKTHVQQAAHHVMALHIVICQANEHYKQ
jgi:hypothetical protein